MPRSAKNIKSEELTLKFTATQWKRINDIVEFSGKDRMNMCCEGVLRWVEELEKQREAKEIVK